ncbi:hypothetical protein [Candidatus Uabimicrobium sp. HlEnr_7]|uniref:hypothetical protein n=1 Tax=Candidatus Uabimicrobium helgolandensis TaxID=3095367 RepID=UPI0035589F0F
MNRKNDVVQASEGLSLDHQGQLLALIEQSSKQTQLLHSQMHNQNKYNRIILLIVFAAIAIIFFLSLQFFGELNKKNPSKADISMEEFNATFTKLAQEYRKEIEDSLNKKTAEMNIKNQKEKDILFKEMEKYYKDIILAMEKARKNSEQLARNSEQLAQKYKQQITDYETRIFIQKKQIREISTRIAEFENEHSLLLKNHKKLQLDNKKLMALNQDLEKRVRPYLTPQEQIELERKKKEDN